MNVAPIALALALGAEARDDAGSKGELLVFAAASLGDVAPELGAAFEEEGGGAVRFNLGASSELARQILAADRADVFLSADDVQMARVVDAGLVEPGTLGGLLSNQLVVVVPRGAADAPSTPDDLADVERVALADPDIVPAGRYARAWLESRGLWESVEPRVVPAMHVRGALGLVASGAAGAGIVYATDVAVSNGVEVAYRVPVGEGPRIVYPVCVLRASERIVLARRFRAFLSGPRARSIFERHGFSVLQDGVVGAGNDAPPTSTVRPFASEALTALGISLEVAAGALLLDLVPGVALAWLLARRRWRGKSIVESLVALPLVLPPTAIGWLLLRLLHRDGVLGPEPLGLELLLTRRGAILAAAVMSFPLVVRTARVAFEGVEPRLETMGRSLGLSRTRVFFGITVPLAKRGLVAAAILGFGRALGEFGATVIVAGNIRGETQTLALAIFENYQQGHDGRALQFVGITLLLAFAISFAVERLLDSGRRGRPGGPSS